MINKWKLIYLSVIGMIIGIATKTEGVFVANFTALIIAMAVENKEKK